MPISVSKSCMMMLFFFTSLYCLRPSKSPYLSLFVKWYGKAYLTARMLRGFTLLWESLTYWAIRPGYFIT